MSERDGPHAAHTWVLILAGGEGKRLHRLTMSGGVAVPKQYCSLAGGQTLLDDAIERSRCVVPADRVCVIVAAQHRQWWQPLLQDLPPENVIVQPKNRGTGIGLLYALTHIAARDPLARLVALPADQYVRDEVLLCSSLRAALRRTEHQERIVLLGVRPDHVDPELGYIVPSANGLDELRAVSRFVEKPDAAAAARLIEQGAVWNTFIFAGAVSAFFDLFSPRYSFVTLEMQAVVSRVMQTSMQWPAILELYERLPTVDFSHDVLASKQHELDVLEVPVCGWSDLGTPQRVAQTLESLPVDHRLRAGRTPFVNLANQQALLQSAVM